MNDITAKLAEALESCMRVLRHGASSPERQAADPDSAMNTAQRLLTTYRQHTEAQAGVTEATDFLSAFQNTKVSTERRPLTELRINQIAAANEVFQYHAGAILEFARDIEAAHNIGTAGTTEQRGES